MSRPITALAATGLALLGVSSLAGAAGTGSPHPRSAGTLTVVTVLGSRVSVPAGQFVKAYARCPRGYYVTGGGAINGAITEIASGPMANLRGWFVDGTNTDPNKRTFEHSADAVCVRGSGSISVAKPRVTRSVLRHAEIAFASGPGALRGR